MGAEHLDNRCTILSRSGSASSLHHRARIKFWVAESKGGVTGFVDWQEDFVNALHVRTSHARSGIGACLMDKAETEIRNSGFPIARLETYTFNTASQAFYAKRGFEEAGRYPDLEWNSGLTTILLVKSLA